MSGTVTDLSVSALDVAAAFVRARTGLVFGDTRRPSFDAAVTRGMRRARLRDVRDYLAHLTATPALLDDLVDGITVGETYFFREPAQLDFLRDAIIPDLVSLRPPGHRLRCWSAGCATGEEPFTLALIARALGLVPPPIIVATDISRTALSRAAPGRYGKWSLRGVADDVVRACFEPEGTSFRLAPAVRAAVAFGYLNLAEDVYPSLASGIWGMDLILCRNVLMYLDRDTAARVARQLVDSLADGGWLLTGASDPPISEMTPCEVVVTDAGLAYRRGTGQADRRRAEVAHSVPVLVSREPWPPTPNPPPTVQSAILPAARPPTLADEPRVAPTLADAQALYAKRDYARAAGMAAQLCNADDGPTAWVVLIRSLANQGDLSAAGRHCAAAIERHRASAELLYLHAVLLAHGGRQAESAMAARGALYLDREFVVAHLSLGTALARLGDVAGAGLSLRNAERLLSCQAPEAVVPASDGEPAGRLTRMVQTQIVLLNEAAV